MKPGGGEENPLNPPWLASFWFWPPFFPVPFRSLFSKKIGVWPKGENCFPFWGGPPTKNPFQGASLDLEEWGIRVPGDFRPREKIKKVLEFGSPSWFPGTRTKSSRSDPKPLGLRRTGSHLCLLPSSLFQWWQGVFSHKRQPLR